MAWWALRCKAFLRHSADSHEERCPGGGFPSKFHINPKMGLKVEFFAKSSAHTPDGIVPKHTLV